MSKTLTVEDFLPHVGQAVQVVAANAELHGQLREATCRGQRDAEGRAPFSLLVTVDGPPTTGQGMYRLVLPGGAAHEIFFVPVGHGDHGLELEAIFG